MNQQFVKLGVVRKFRAGSDAFTQLFTARPSAKDDTGASVQRKGARRATKASVSLNVQPASRSSESQHTATSTITDTAPGDIHAPTEQGNVIQTTAGRNTTSKAGGRQSGRLREKGPTTYNARGEVFRGGKRVNEYKYADI